MSSKPVFQKRTVPAAHVQQAEAVAATSPLTGDPRLPQTQPTSAAPAVNAAAPDGDLSTYLPGQTVDIPLERIKSNPLNPRALYTSRSIDEMAESLKAQGQLIPATGYVDGEFIVLIEGETRLRGSRVAGRATLQVQIKARPASERELYRQARTANVRRRDQTALDDALRWKQLLEANVYKDQADLSRELEVDETVVSRTLALADLPQPVLLALSDMPDLHSFQMLNAVRMYFKGFGADKTLAYLPEIVKEGRGYRKVLQDAQLAQSGPVQRARGERETVTYAGAKGEIKVFKGGRVELGFKGLDEEKVAALVLKIKEVFQ